MKKVGVILGLFLLLMSSSVFGENYRPIVFPLNRTLVIGGRQTIFTRIYRYQDGQKTSERIQPVFVEYKLDHKLLYRSDKKPFYFKESFLGFSNGTHLFSLKVRDEKGNEYLFVTNILVSNVTVTVKARLLTPIPSERKLYLAGSAPSLSVDFDHWSPHGALFKKVGKNLYEAHFLTGLNSRVAIEMNLGSWAMKARDKKGNVIHQTIKIKKANQIIDITVDNWGKISGHISRAGVVIGFTGRHRKLLINYTHPKTNIVALSYRYDSEPYKTLVVTNQTFSHFEIPFVGGKTLSYHLSPFRKTNSFVVPKDKLPFKFLVVGDIRLNFSSPIPPLMAKEKNVAFVIDTGDIVFSGLRATDWNSFFRAQKKIISRFFYQPAVGNHDEESPLYEKVVGRPFWYDFVWGNTVFINLNDNSPFAAGTTQYKWLKKTLKKYKDMHFKVVSFHVPIYTSRIKGLNIDGIKYLVPLFEKYGVDLVLNGDDHGYEASWPVRHGKVVKKHGVIYVVCAGGGAPLYDITKRGFWNRFDKKTYHYVRITVSKHRMHVEAVDGKGKVFDRFDIRK